MYIVHIDNAFHKTDKITEKQTLPLVLTFFKFLKDSEKGEPREQDTLLLLIFSSEDS